MACMALSGIGFSNAFATTYLYDSPLTVNQTTTDLGGGIFQYDLSFTNVDTSNIWHFIVWTTAPTTLVSASLASSDSGHAVPADVDSAYDATNLQADVTWMEHMWEGDFGGNDGVQIGEVGNLSFTTNYLTSSFLYGYETGESGYAPERRDNSIAAVGRTTTNETIPEPATMLLLGFGLMGVAGIKRKLKK